MSYDIAVFEPNDALRDRASFLAWYESRTQWGPRAYDPTYVTPRLKSWFNEMIETYPPLNTPNRPSMRDADRWPNVVDYVFAEDMIYVAISGASVTIGRETVTRIAAKHGVGVYERSDSGDVLFPTASGTLEIAHRDENAAPFDPTQPLNAEGINDLVRMILEPVPKKPP